MTPDNTITFFEFANNHPASAAVIAVAFFGFCSVAAWSFWKAMQ